jgi:hypothetical protein
MTPHDMKLQREGFIDDITLHREPFKRGFRLVVERTYAQVAEQLDLAVEAGWVKWNRARQGVE